MTATADLWYHYGRTRHAADRAVPDAFFWNWGQDSGPGTEVLGGLDDRVVGDLGAGAARHAAHLTARRRPARVDAIDASPRPARHGNRSVQPPRPRLHIVCADVVHHLRATVGTYDVLYSVFGAVDFTDPRELLPAAAAALRPGGRLVFSTLAHYLTGAPAQPADIHAAPATPWAITVDDQCMTFCQWRVLH